MLFPEINYTHEPQRNISELVQNNQGRHNVIMIQINNI